MSHQPERKEKNCLNCGTTVIGRYCHVCGQENVVTKESFWSLSRHFVFDILHFDGKFFHTLKYLLIRPGKVAREYCEGKRNTYLHPIRMYLFTSAVFFLVFFSVNKNDTFKTNADTKYTWSQRQQMDSTYTARLKKNPGDSVALKKIITLLKDSTKEVRVQDLVEMDPKPFVMDSRRYGSLKEYDSVQAALPSSQRDNWAQRLMRRRIFKLNEKYKGHLDEGMKIVLEGFLHRLPYMLFLSLPFFALILKLLYARRKNFFYSDHAIFTLFHYVFSFFLLFIFLAISQLEKYTGVQDLDWIMVILVVYWLLYLLLELKKFYRQSWGKTVVKFLLLDFLGLIVMVLLFLAFILFSVFEI